MVGFLNMARLNKQKPRLPIETVGNKWLDGRVANLALIGAMWPILSHHILPLFAFFFAEVLRERDRGRAFMVSSSSKRLT